MRYIGRGRPRSERADYDRMTARVPPELSLFIRDQAELEGRTVNEHLITLLHLAVQTYRLSPRGQRHYDFLQTLTG